MLGNCSGVIVIAVIMAMLFAANERTWHFAKGKAIIARWLRDKRGRK